MWVKQAVAGVEAVEADVEVGVGGGQGVLTGR